MLEQIGSDRRKNENPLGDLFKTSAVLRIGAGLVLMSRHAWDALIAAYQFLWKEVPWDLVTTFAKEGVPLPHLAAPTAALLLFVIATSWIVGFLSRLFAFLLFLSSGLALLFAQGDYAAFSELCWLYLLIAFTLMLFGSGAISLDRLFNIGARPRKSRTHRY
jgi:uncharacterized membrane protein YphA (DoxX/SURF4 family)